MLSRNIVKIKTSSRKIQVHDIIKDPNINSDKKVTLLIEQYRVLSDSRISHDELFWEVPLMFFTAQAFLMTIALGVNENYLWWARAFAAYISFVFGFLSIQVFERDRLMEVTDSEQMLDIENYLISIGYKGVLVHQKQDERRYINKQKVNRKLSSGGKLSFLNRVSSFSIWKLGMYLTTLISFVVFIIIVFSRFDLITNIINNIESPLINRLMLIFFFSFLLYIIDEMMASQEKWKKRVKCLIITTSCAFQNYFLYLYFQSTNSLYTNKSLFIYICSNLLYCIILYRNIKRLYNGYKSKHYHMNKLHSDDINPVYNIILAGGKSTRLEARVSDIDAKKPKFLIVNYGDQPLLECTVKRNMKFSHKQVIVTNTDYYELIKKSISKRLLPAKNNTCFEEENLGTAYAIFNGINFISDLAKIHVKKKKKVLNIDPIIIVTPSDHVIEDQAAYQYSITKTIQLACAFNCLYVLGIPPEYPTTEYGYFTITPICENTTNGSVKSFIEKPSSKKVMELCSISSCYWNSGIFIGKFSIFKKLFANYPLNDTKTSSAVENGNGSFDQDILEKAVKDHPDWIRGIKAHFDWIDIGVPDTLEQCLIDERCKLKPIKE